MIPFVALYHRLSIRPFAALAFACLLLAGCKSHTALQNPALEITRVPAADAGGPAQLDYIEGKATGVAPGQQIVLYAHSGVWWIQPFKAQPFTKIQPDSTWKNSTHLGTEYAALLVDSSYHPASRLETIPAAGNGVLAVVTAKGTASAHIAPKTIHFSGYDWTARAAGSSRGGEPNFYDPTNAWTDEKGYLHLRMTQLDGKWTCAEVNMTHSLGYGSYRFVVQDSTHLSPSAVLGMFTWDEGAPDDTRKELDFELSRWGNSNRNNAQFVVQPYYVPENVSRFTVPPGEMTYMLRWEPGTASFKAFHGSTFGIGEKSISEHVFSSGIPGPALETVHIDLYDFHHSRSTDSHPAEVVIEKFEFLP